MLLAFNIAILLSVEFWIIFRKKLHRTSVKRIFPFICGLCRTWSRHSSHINWVDICTQGSYFFWGTNFQQICQKVERNLLTGGFSYGKRSDKLSKGWRFREGGGGRLLARGCPLITLARFGPSQTPPPLLVKVSIRLTPPSPPLCQRY